MNPLVPTLILVLYWGSTTLGRTEQGGKKLEKGVLLYVKDQAR